MPSFEVDNSTSDTTTFDFEVYCDTCGFGLCDLTREVLTRRRNMPSIRVTACTNCMKSKQDKIDELNHKVEQLESKVENLEDQLTNL